MRERYLNARLIKAQLDQTIIRPTNTPLIARRGFDNHTNIDGAVAQFYNTGDRQISKDLIAILFAGFQIIKGKLELLNRIINALTISNAVLTDMVTVVGACS